MKQGSSFKVSRSLISTTLLVFGVGVFINGFTRLQAQSSDCVAPPAGLVSWWPGEGNANDIVGTNNGTLSSTGASYTTGLVGQAFRFDGTNGYVQIPDSPSLKPTNLTLEAWVWLDPALPAHRGGEQIIFKKNTWNAWFEGYSLLKDTIDNGDGTYSDRFQFCVSRYGNQVIINSTTIAQRGVWYYVAATYDGNRSTLYVNGVAEATATPGFALDYGTDPVYIGTSGTWAPYLSMFGGIIDEPSIYNRALSSNEIAAIYHAGSAGKCPPTPPPSTQPLINVDFGAAGGRGYSLKTGFAAIGQTTNDFWNFYDRDRSSTPYDWRTSGTLTNLHLADGTVTTIGMTVSDAPGAWGDGSSDPMYGTYDYPLDGGNNVVTFTNLPAGHYDVLAYSPDGNFEITIDRISYGVKTCYDSAASGAPVWAEGVQYVRFTNITVAVGQSLALTAHPTGRNPALLSGIQIIGSSSPPECTPPPAGLVSWWPGEGNANDIAGGNSGIVSSALTYTTGEVGQAFLMNSTNAYFYVPASPRLNVGLGSGFTIEAWIKPSNVSGLHPIVEWNNETGGIGIQLWIGQTPASQGVLCASLLDTNGNNYIQVASPSGKVLANTWQHVAFTYDRTTHTVKLFVNAALVAQSGWSGDVPQTSYNLWVGRRPEDCGGSCWTDGTCLTGPLDELSLYDRALSSNEIAAIYHAGSAGKCPLPPTVFSVTPTNQYVNEDTTVFYTVHAAGSPTLAYQWQHDGSDIFGATNSILTLSNVMYSQAGNYDVVVSNPVGWIVSSNVVLRVNRAPIADASATQPLAISPNASNAVVVLNGSKSSDPDGDALTYMWFRTGDAIPLATGVVAMPTLPVGTNELTLTVNDSMASNSQAFAVEVITTSKAVDRLIALAQTGSGNTRPLVASLEAALASIDRSKPQTAINQLGAFINKVQAQLEPSDPDMASKLIADARAIIDALNGGTALPTTQLEITSISHGHNGKPHLKIKGGIGRIYVVETSTNMVDWVPIGVATQNSDGTYDFHDTQSQNSGERFYRVVSP